MEWKQTLLSLLPMNNNNKRFLLYSLLGTSFVASAGYLLDRLILLPKRAAAETELTKKAQSLFQQAKNTEAIEILQQIIKNINPKSFFATSELLLHSTNEIQIRSLSKTLSQLASNDFERKMAAVYELLVSKFCDVLTLQQQNQVTSDIITQCEAAISAHKDTVPVKYMLQCVAVIADPMLTQNMEAMEERVKTIVLNMTNYVIDSRSRASLAPGADEATSVDMSVAYYYSALARGFFTEQGIRMLNLSLEHYPQNVRPRMRRAKSYLYSNHYQAYPGHKRAEMAKYDYEKVVQINPQYTEAYMNLAEVELLLGNVQPAKKALTTCNQKRPEYLEAYIRLAKLKLFSEKERNWAAIDHIFERVPVSSRNFEWVINKLSFQFALGQFSDCSKACNELLSLSLLRQQQQASSSSSPSSPSHHQESPTSTTTSASASSSTSSSSHVLFLSADEKLQLQKLMEYCKDMRTASVIFEPISQLRDEILLYTQPNVSTIAALKFKIHLTTDLIKKLSSKAVTPEEEHKVWRLYMTMCLYYYTLENECLLCRNGIVQLFEEFMAMISSKPYHYFLSKNLFVACHMFQYFTETAEILSVERYKQEAEMKNENIFEYIFREIERER